MKQKRYAHTPPVNMSADVNSVRFWLDTSSAVELITR